jgi:hypothetical protein
LCNEFLNEKFSFSETREGPFYAHYAYELIVGSMGREKRHDRRVNMKRPIPILFRATAKIAFRTIKQFLFYLQVKVGAEKRSRKKKNC